ncbi:MAG: dihydrolipoyl dehydrogenase [Bdellovibrio sp. CG10_big_fil_rev_8_21_14_0_10_47_8]|nr:MAG: dihydrolipoyl dehydrogenase [Bdellovibrio sp. CG10_big_fil_rev_8_21_14_0_10_47_8]
MKKASTRRYLLLAIIGLLAIGYFATDAGSYLTLDSLKSNRQLLTSEFQEHPMAIGLAFGLLYVVVTALSIPGAAVLTLAGGAIFGALYGTLIVSISSTIGASLAFLGARYLFRDSIEKKFRERLSSINDGIQREGNFYLFTLRLIPVFPFFLVNLLMGLTSFRLLPFFIVSQIGMLPGTFVYVNAGTELSKIDSLKGILSPEIIGAFTLLGLLPLLSKWVIGAVRSRRHLRKYRRPEKFDYNMVVIGGGSAGLVSAYIASAVKAKVALIEKHKMGGDCLNTGCVPSKALIRSAKIFSYMKRADDFGIEKVDLKLNFAKVMDRVQKVIAEVEPHDSVERYSKLGVDCITGEAKIKSPYEVHVNGRTITTRNIVVATGARPLVPPIPGLDKVKSLTSDNIWALRELPNRLLVLGGGPIGCELAQSFARLGSKVTLVEMADRIMVREDVDVSAEVTEVFKREGIELLTSYRAVRIEANAQGKFLVCESKGQEVVIAFDEILLALGRKANVSGFGLEELEVEISKRGTVVADDFLSTPNYPNIYVCGDVTGPYQFTHTASHQAWFVAVNALFRPFKAFKVDYRVIPWCTFTDPEVARVGLNEIEAKEKGVEYEVTRYGIDDLDRAITDSEAHGFVKVLTTPGKDKILGVTIVGHHAGDIIAEYVVAMKHGFGLNKILGTIHIYPTLSEANKYAAGVWKREHAPAFALGLLERFHQWRRN